MAIAARYAALGLKGRTTPAALAEARAATRAEDPRIRSAALGALVRAADVSVATERWRAATVDVDPTVRRRAAELGPGLARREPGRATEYVERLVPMLDDREVTVVEAVSWAIGEIGAEGEPVTALARVVTSHRDPLAREAAVAALGAIADPEGLPAILAACTDKPAVRRRAVLALAPFDGPEVNGALRAALDDHDWQVRQSAEDLLGAGTPGQRSEISDGDSGRGTSP